MKKWAVWMAVAGMAAAAWGAGHAVKADGRLAALRAGSDPVAPLEWEHVGQIVDDEGNPVTGAQTLVVRLYGAAEGGDILWVRQAPVLLDADGIFSVRLSDALAPADGAPEIPLARVLAGHTCWIECQIDGHSGAMAPRAAVTAVPFALFADGAEGAMDDFEASVSLVVAGKTTAKSISARDVVSSNEVNVSGKLSVGGNASVEGGLHARSYSGVGALPPGTIIMWYGNPDTGQPPEGWKFCDNRFGGKFPVGAGDQYEVGDDGGKETVVLGLEHLPSHSHGYELRNDSNRGQPIIILADYQDLGVWHGDKKFSTGETGGGVAHSNLPPYRVLRFIRRVE